MSQITYGGCCVLALSIALGLCDASLHAQTTAPTMGPATTQADNDAAALTARIRQLANGPQNEETLRAQRDLMIKLLALEATRQNGLIVLQGEVVDDTGRPLDGVNASLRISKATAPGPGWSTHRDSMERRTVDKAFDWRFDNCASVQVYFWKEGYYGVDLAGRMGVPQKGVKIVLQKKGQLTDLDTYSGRVAYHPNGDGSIFDLAKDPSEQRMDLLPRIDDAAKVLPGAVFVKADRSAEGQIDLVQLKTETGMKVFPKNMRLCVNDDKGGFLLHDPKGMRERRALRQMRQAPEEGYAKELVFTPEMCGRWLQADGPGMYFYFKSGGRYGKGFIKDLLLDAHTGQFTAYVILQLQSDGSRNLEARTEY